MKNLTKIFMAVVAGMFAFSCVTDTTEDLGVQLGGAHKGQTTLSISMAEVTKTHLGEKVGELYPLLWSEGDAIAVNGVVSTPLTAEQADANVASFTLDVELEQPYCVVYPAEASRTEGDVTEGEEVVEPEPEPANTVYPVNFLAEQPYTVGTFAPKAAPMYGYTTEKSMIQMQHLTGVLRLAVKGNGEKVTSILIRAEGGKIAGAFTVDCATGAVVAGEEAVNTVTVTFAEPLVLGDEAQVVYATVPAGSYGTFMVTINTEAHEKMTVKFNSDVKPINAGTVREFGAFTYEANSADTEDGVFLIETKEDLIEFARIASVFYPRTQAKVVATINMAGYDWTPIEGFGAYEFDGGSEEGCSINGLNAPLFGSTAATIKNLELTGVNYTITDLAKSGAIACELHNGLLDNCKASGAININATITIENPVNEYGDIVHGGLVGHVFGATVTDCVNDVDITVTSLCEASLSIKAAVGGVVGGATSAGVGCTFNDLTNEGNIDYVCTTQKGNVYLSGVVGKESDGTSDVDIADIDNCTNNGYISTSKTSKSGDMLLAGITGVIDSDVATLCENLTNNGALTHSGTCGGFRAAGIASYWARATAKNWHNTATGDITVADDATISTTCYLSGLVSGTFTTNGISLCDNEGALTIGDNITFNGYVRLSGIADTVGSTETPEISCWNDGPLSIGYCSNTKTDTNSGRLYMSGLINTLNSGALNECDNKVGGTITANLNSWASQLMIGGIVGYQGGTISIKDQVLSLTDCENFAAIDIKAVSAKAAYVGGISGQSYVDPEDKLDFTAELTRCHNHATITVGGTNPGGTDLGGIIGHINTIHTVMEDCENKADATLTFNPTGTSTVYMGGIVGYTTQKRSATITDCTNAADIVNGCVGNNHQMGGIVGYNASGNGHPLTITGTIGTDTNSGDILCKVGLSGTGGTGRNTVAGIIGQIAGGTKNSTYNVMVTIENCTNSGKVQFGNITFAGRVDMAGICALNGSYSTGTKITGCVNKGTVVFDAVCTGTSKEISFGGIVGTAQATALIINCTNEVDATILSNGASKSNYDVGGIAGSSSGTGVEIINCVNKSAVTMSRASGGTTQIGGIIGYAYTYGKICGCANYGTVTGYAKSQTGIAGIAGYARQQVTGGTAYITHCYNEGEVHAKGTGSTVGVGGVIGITYGVEKGAADFSELVNVGKIVYTATASTPGIGGIFGHDRNHASTTSIVDSKCYCDIVAVGKEGKVGMIFGVAPSANRNAQNCGVAGNLIFEQTEEPSEVPGQESTITDIPTPIDASNLLSYIYPTAVTEANGCYVLETKPTRPVYTYTPAE